MGMLYCLISLSLSLSFYLSDSQVIAFSLMLKTNRRSYSEIARQSLLFSYRDFYSDSEVQTEKVCQPMGGGAVSKLESVYACWC